MSTGNDPALPDSENQPALTPVEAAVAHVAATEPGEGDPPNPGLKFTAPIEEVDPDDVALRDAMATAQAEEAGAEANPQGDPPQDPANPTPAKTPAEGEPAQGAQPQGHAPVPTIPKPRFDAALSERDKARQEAAYWQGVAKAREGQPAGTPGQAQPAPAAPTPEQRLATIHQAQDALAARFDAGEITMADFKREERKLNNDEQTIREEGLAARLKPATAPAAPANDLYLAEKTQQIEQANPWLTVADQLGTDAEWEIAKREAIQRCIDKGQDPTKGDAGRYQLRIEVANVWNEWAPAMLSGRAKAKGIALPGSQQPAPQGQQQPPALSPAAKARAAQLQRAAGAPPDLANMTGAVGDPANVVNESNVEFLTEDDFDKMPTAAKNRLLGISA